MRRIKPETLVRCKYCGSVDIVRFGTYKGVQRWWCKDCKRKFTDVDALPKMKTPIELIARALSMYYGGMSLGSISRHFEQHYGLSMTPVGIYNWIIRFTKEAIDKTKHYKPSVGDVWVADETVLKIGGKYVWFWDIIDAKTRFLLASHLSDHRTAKDALVLMKMAEARAGKVPQVVLTDKLLAYLDGIEMAWGADTKHIPSKGFQEPFNTNLIERMHGTIKDRTKVMRGMKKVDTAKMLMGGFSVHYNYFRPHMALKGKTPAEKAGIRYTDKDWGDVVRGEEKPPMAKGQDKDDVRLKPIRDKPSFLRKPIYKRETKPKPKRVKPRVKSGLMLKEIRLKKGG